MSAPLPAIHTPRCTRCNSRLAYEGRPCALCYAPAIFRYTKSGARQVRGAARPRDSRLPRFAQPLAVRGKKARLPSHERVIRTLRIAGRWTWNSIVIAAIVHGLVLAAMLFMRPQLEQARLAIQQILLERDAAVAPTPAPEEVEQVAEIPEVLEEETVLPDRIIEEALDAGEPEIETPPEEITHAPQPQVAPPRPAPALPFPPRMAEQPQGIGGGQPEPASRVPAGAGLFRNRQGEQREAAVRRHGGGEETEDAVNLGLEYLAKQQSRDGSWEVAAGFEVPPSWARNGSRHNASLTALCTLPFLAAGHSPKEGRYQRNVSSAIRWLMRRQTSDGNISHNEPGDMYTHCVATLALCEAYAMTGDPAYRRSAERAVRFLERTQGPGGGWDYRGVIPGGRNSVSSRSDGSITGWAVLALNSARYGGIDVNETTWSRIADLYDALSLDTGETYYADAPYGRLPGTRKGIAMVGVGLTSRVLLDSERFEKRDLAARQRLLEHLPEWSRFREPTYDSVNPNFNTFYGMYCCTLGMFLHTDGRGPAWERWNKSLKEALLPYQVKQGDRRGSWPAADSWIGPIMGDLYSTACAVLCLEVYYRYSPSHQPPSHPLPRGRPAGAPPVVATPGDRSRELRQTVRDKGMDALGELLKALRDDSPTMRTTALFEIGRLGAAVAAPTVAAMLADRENESLRLTIADTLGKLGDRSVHPALIRLLADNDDTLKETARRALTRLSDGKDFGINARAWQDWFQRNA